MPAVALTLSPRPPLRAPLRLMTDAQLVSRATRGDRDALSGIFARHHQSIYRYCRSLVGNDTDAQDALQNTMIRVLRALPGEQREIVLKPWLYRIAHNESMRILGARRSHEALEDAPEPAAPDETAGAEARERLAKLTADLQELTQRARAALVLRELNGASFEEIGTTFGISATAAKQAVYEARTALQDFEAGRAMRCEDVTRAISDGDGRRLRQRKLRAHLRACDDCRAFRAALERRASDFRMLAPPLAPAVAAGLLADLLGAGGGTAAGTGVAAAGGGKAIGGIAATTTKMTAAAVATKSLAVVAVTAAAGVGVLQATQSSDPPTSSTRPAESGQARAAATSAQPGPASSTDTPAEATRRVEKQKQVTEGSSRQRAARSDRRQSASTRTDEAPGRPEPSHPTSRRSRPVDGHRTVPQADRKDAVVRVSPRVSAPTRGTPPTSPSSPPTAPTPDAAVDAPRPAAAPNVPAAAPTTAPEVPSDSSGGVRAPAEDLSE